MNKLSAVSDWSHDDRHVGNQISEQLKLQRDKFGFSLSSLTLNTDLEEVTPIRQSQLFCQHPNLFNIKRLKKHLRVKFIVELISKIWDMSK